MSDEKDVQKGEQPGSQTSTSVQEKAPPPAAQNDEYLSGKRLYLAIVGILMAVFLISLDQTIVATANPVIASQFNALSKISWITSSYFLTQVGTLMLHGQLCTLIPVKWIFLVNIAIFELGSLFCAVAPSMNFLIFGRAFAGVGGAGLFVSALNIIAESIAVRQRSLVFGGLSAIFGVASVTAPILGGVFSDKVTWRLCFYINLPLGVITIITGLFILDAKTPSKVAAGDTRVWWRRILSADWIGSGLTLATFTLLLLALQIGGNTAPWNSGEVIGIFVGFAVLFILTGLWSWYMGPKAALPLVLFTRRTQVGVCIHTFMMMLTNLVATYFLPLAFQAVRRASAVMSGVDIIPFMISKVLVSIITGWIIARIGHYWGFIFVGPCLTAVGAGLLFSLQDSLPTGKVIGYQILYGIGFGASLNFTMIAVQQDYAQAGLKHLTAQATALVTVFQFLGGDLGISIAGAIFVNKLSSNLALLAPSADAKALFSSVTAIFDLPPNEQAGAIEAFSRSLSVIYALSIAAAGLAVLACSLIKSFDVKKPVTAAAQKKEPEDPAISV